MIKHNSERNNENSIEFYTNSDVMTLSLTQKKYINKWIKLQKENPTEIEIIKNFDGSILVHAPISYLRFNKKRTVTMTEEQKRKLVEKLQCSKQK